MGIIAAALANADRLVLVNRGVGITAFNYINTLLLRVARNADDYLYLRTNTDQWHQRLPLHVSEEFYGAHLPSKSKRAFIEESRIFWNHVHAFDHQSLDIFYALVGTSVCSTFSYEQDMVLFHACDCWAYLCADNGSPPYMNASFFSDERLFQRAKRLAQTVLFKTANIGDRVKVTQLLEYLQSNNILIGTVDTSDLFLLKTLCQLMEAVRVYDVSESYYRRAYDAFVFLTTLQPVLAADALLVTTENKPGQEFGYMTRDGEVVSPPRSVLRWKWVYKGAFIADVLNNDCVEMSAPDLEDGFPVYRAHLKIDDIV